MSGKYLPILRMKFQVNYFTCLRFFCLYFWERVIQKDAATVKRRFYATRVETWDVKRYFGID